MHHYHCKLQLVLRHTATTESQSQFTGIDYYGVYLVRPLNGIGISFVVRCSVCAPRILIPNDPWLRMHKLLPTDVEQINKYQFRIVMPWNDPTVDNLCWLRAILHGLDHIQSVHNPELLVLAAGSAVFFWSHHGRMDCLYSYRKFPPAEMVQSLACILLPCLLVVAIKAASAITTLRLMSNGPSLGRCRLGNGPYLGVNDTIAKRRTNQGRGRNLHTCFMDVETFFQLRQALSFGNDTVWTYKEMQRHMQDNVVERGGRLYTAHPLPLVPKEYDPNYRPQYLVLQSISKSLYRDVSALDESIQEGIKRGLQFSPARLIW